MGQQSETIRADLRVAYYGLKIVCLRQIDDLGLTGVQVFSTQQGLDDITEQQLEDDDESQNPMQQSMERKRPKNIQQLDDELSFDTNQEEALDLAKGLNNFDQPYYQDDLPMTKL